MSFIQVVWLCGAILGALRKHSSILCYLKKRLKNYNVWNTITLENTTYARSVSKTKLLIIKENLYISRQCIFNIYFVIIMKG